MSRRIIVLGSTGIDKSEACSRVVELAKKEYGAGKVEYLDFEKEFLKPQVDNFHDYLDNVERAQREQWKQAWLQCNERVKTLGDKDVILGMHGIINRPLYDVRSPVDIGALLDFGATAIITLIDDVYSEFLSIVV